MNKLLEAQVRTLLNRISSLERENESLKRSREEEVAQGPI
jgi:hypothetical protein